MRGTGLSNAKVESSTAGLTPSNPKTSANGHYLFFDLTVAENVQPGTYQLKVTSAGGAANAAFSVFTALPRYGNYSGYSTDDVIYQLIPDRFANGDPANDDPARSKGSFDRAKPQSYHGGDLQGVADKLAYLKSLGATALWLTPLYDNYDKPDINAYDGYGVTDLYSVDEHFGDLAKLKEFVRKAHLAGFVLIQDQIINHVGPDHAWANDPPTPTWFNGTPQNHLSDDGQRWTTMDPRATYQMQKRNLEGWTGNTMPDLNQKDPEVEKYLIQNSLWWLAQTGYDAIRVGEIANVPRTFLAKWTAAINRENSKVNILGDVPDADASLVSYFQGGKRGPDGVDTQITSLADTPLSVAIRDAFARDHAIRGISQVIAHDWLYPKPEALASFLGSHDTQRFMNEPGATIDGLKLAETFLMTTRGTPIIYYGDEIAIRGANAQDFPGGSAGDAKNAFTPAGRTAEENDVWNYLAKLGSVRHDLEPLRRGSLLDLVDDEQQMAFARVTLKDAVVVVFNNDTKAADLSFDISMIKLISPNATLTDALGKLGDVKINNGIVTIKMPARTAAILS
ncbi:MAG: alpha-amylase family glycosyl hydrolase, partial [Pyrinomonadaceae bacterium]